MKRADQLTPECDYHRHLQEYDLRELDSPRLRCVFRLKYLARLERLRTAAARIVPPGGRLLEVGCAQANLSLLLAEDGYEAVALDLLPAALTYARAKHERGIFHPIAGSAANLPFAPAAFDAVILAELLEHCARPAEIIAEALRVTRPGGYLLVTTLNGEYPGADEPLYNPDRGPSAADVARQYGPDAPDHLFAFTRQSLAELLGGAGLRVLRCEYVGSGLLANRCDPLKRLLPVPAILALSALVNRLPGLGRRYSLNLFALAQKTGS